MPMESSHLPDILKSMHRPDFYPHPVQTISLEETHISFVVLTGDYVYKIKKPVDDVFILLDFYKCYRAFVRAKVNCFRLKQSELGDNERGKLLRQTRRYKDLAYQYAVLFTRPTVWVVCGMIASGKSTLARALAEVLQIKVR